MNEKYNLILLVLVGILVGAAFHGFSSLFEESASEPEKPCPIEYGKLVCVNGSPAVGFYNENDISIKNIKIAVPKDSGQDIYNVTEPLKPEATESLILFNSDCSLDQSEIRLFWCCNNCFNTTMDNPSKDIEVTSSHT